ncbi:putative transcription regulator PAB1642 [Aspergillus saccharolyticus JOP 1030-1]|uniref:Heme oxygenase-like protein n=1 Tax=Aspergillus saccharolyticus JOP 1030-1 TaxID=1450539 RepID=A0A318ZDP4_9EURO|nr:heme oxygenase-like protein [Aspergillus saccharolyticus JOP 1030-1]PYH45479.1 heme oxygenase-like protein [Aspergillus saccharolyticus JOP 1030-1]
MAPLTTTLQCLPLPPPTFTTATSPAHHPFLSAAATGTLPKPALSAWLAQDRLYIHAYIRFIGLLLAKLELPIPHQQQQPYPESPTTNTTTTTTTDKSTRLPTQTLQTLTAALNNITRELDFFITVADLYGLDLNAPFSAATASTTTTGTEFAASPITTAYTDLFISAGSAGTSLLEGLVVLWATEVCYLTVWRNVRDEMAAAGAKGITATATGGADADGGALREKLIPNWTCPEFEEFVEGITRLVDAVAESEIRKTGQTEEEVVKRCARWWRQVVWLEGQFWPQI